MQEGLSAWRSRSETFEDDQQRDLECGWGQKGEQQAGLVRQGTAEPCGERKPLRADAKGRGSDR